MSMFSAVGPVTAMSAPVPALICPAWSRMACTSSVVATSLGPCEGMTASRAVPPSGLTPSGLT